METNIPADEWFAKLGTGSAHSVSEKVSRKKKYPVGFAPPKPKPPARRRK
jgi:hypothetical protein